jgi:hypothetical protein
MLNTFIKNRGTTKTIIHNNNDNNVNEIKWDADYDGDVANISLDLTNNGNVNHYNVKLNNDDLANILNINSVKMPIHKRLEKDFKKASFHKDPSMYNIYLDDFRSPALMPIPPIQTQTDIDKPDSFTDEILQTMKPSSRVLSPLPNEELIIPLTIDENESEIPVIFNGNTKHRLRPKTHKVYHRLYNSARGLSKKRRKIRRYKTQRKNRHHH